MFSVNEDLSIYATRGDIVFFSVAAEEDGKPYKFQPGDVVRFKVFGKKDAENVVLQRDFPVSEECEEVQIILTKADTKIGEVISKYKDYWYEVILNDDSLPQTIIGYDEDGAKLFRLFPEGDDIPEYEPDPEEFKVMDDALDMTSTRPVQNQAIARAMTSLTVEFEQTKANITDKSDNAVKSAADANNAVAVERARVDQIVSGATPDGAEVVDIRVGADGVTYESAGTAVREQIKAVRDCFEFATGANVYDPARANVGYVMQHGGVLAENEEYTLTDFIFVPYGYSVMATCKQSHGGRATTILDGTSRIIKSLCVFEQDKSTIIEEQGSSSQVGWYANVITESDKWVRVTFKHDVTPELMIEVLPVAYGTTTGEPNDYQTSLTAVGIKEYVPFFVTKKLKEECLAASWYSGKKVTVLGDSITQLNTWQPYVAEYFGCEMVNCGTGGSRVANYPKDERTDYMCGDSRIDAIPEDSDVILVFGGHNDFSVTCPVGDFTPWWSLTDESASNEFIPAYALLIKKLTNRFPAARLMLMTCIGGRTSNEAENQDSNFYLRGLQMDDYSEVIRRISKYFGIPCIDTGAESGINTLNHTTYIADVIHPNDEGGKMIANAVINGLKRFEPIDFV